MVNYQRGKIYKIVSSLPEHKDQCYVGSTTKSTLAKRMSKHRFLCREGATSQLSQIMREHGIHNFSIVLIESHPCNSKDELHARERYWMDQLNSLTAGWNKNRSSVTLQERKDKKRETKAILHARNKAEGKYPCPVCNLQFSEQTKLTRHLNGRTHQANKYRHDNNGLHCIHCNYQTANISNYKKHLTSQLHHLNQLSDATAP